VRFLSLQVTVKATTGREEKRGGNRSRAPCLLDFPAAPREPTRRSVGGAWRRRAATVFAPRNLPALFRAFPAITVDFWVFVL